MRQELPYRQMELGDTSPGAPPLSPDQVREQAEQARLRMEYYEAQRAQYEAQQRAIEENDAQKSLFNAGLNELGMKLHNAVSRLERELESMNREQLELSRITECLRRHLQILSALQPQTWKPAEYQERIAEALPKLERAENDFNEAYVGGNHYRHTDIMRHKPGSDEERRFSPAVLGRQFLKGLAFHLPLFLLLIISWLIYLLIIHF